MLPAGCIFYAFKIEPYRLTVNEYCLTEKKQETESIKIVQFSDTHIKEDFTYGNLNKIVNSINKQDPDIVIFTGDLYDNYAKYNDDVNIIAELQKINAKYDKIAIWGNHDHGGGAVRQYESIMEQAGFILLKNENWYITTDAEKKILFTGLDDSMLGNINMLMIPTVNFFDNLFIHIPHNISCSNFGLYISFSNLFPQPPYMCIYRSYFPKIVLTPYMV